MNKVSPKSDKSEVKHAKKSPGKISLTTQEDLMPHYNALYDAFLQLKSRAEYERFMTDLCTPAEMLSFVERWRVAKLLNDEKFSYQQIHAQTGVSITTIGRVARFLTQESYHGYRLVMDRLKKK